MYKAIGGIDLAVLEGTYTYPNVAPAMAHSRINTNILLVGRDAIAVEAVGAKLVGLDPQKMPVIKEAMNRGLGEGNVEKIEVLGSSIKSLHQRFPQLLKAPQREKVQHLLKMGINL